MEVSTGESDLERVETETGYYTGADTALQSVLYTSVCTCRASRIIQSDQRHIDKVEAFIFF